MGVTTGTRAFGDSMEEAKIKVTDRRMFTEDGELREDNQSTEEESADQQPAASRPTSQPNERSSTGPVDAGPSTAEAGPSQTEPSTHVAREPGNPGSGDRRSPDRNAAEPGPREPQFIELVASLAEPIALFLGDAELPGGESAEDLGRARYYIDLLKVLRQKTQGNLTSEEEALLGDLLYRLQMRYVQKKG